MKIGLLGGSFDPIHEGHLMLAQCAVEEMGLDRVEFIPCRQSPHKERATMADEEQRCRMIELAIADLDWAHLNRLELERTGPSYSWQTAKWYAEQFPGDELFWILGSDQWDVIETWARADRLAELLTFVVFPRGSVPQAKAGYRMRVLKHEHDASSTAIRGDREAGRKFLADEVYAYASQEGIYRW